MAPRDATLLREQSIIQICEALIMMLANAGTILDVRVGCGRAEGWDVGMPWLEVQKVGVVAEAVLAEGRVALWSRAIARILLPGFLFSLQLVGRLDCLERSDLPDIWRFLHAGLGTGSSLSSESTPQPLGGNLLPQADAFIPHLVNLLLLDFALLPPHLGLLFAEHFFLILLLQLLCQEIDLLLLDLKHLGLSVAGHGHVSLQLLLAFELQRGLWPFAGLQV